MDCAMQSFFGLIGSHDPAIIPKASCSASVVRNRDISRDRHERGQIKNHDQECLGIGRSDKGGFSFSSRLPFLRLGTRFRSFSSAKRFH
jgi:hypothetical protein